MNKKLIAKSKKYLTNHKNKKIYRNILTVLASIVVFCTVYALIMPAITIEEVLICEKLEHVHNENCYTDNFICEDTEQNRSDDACYELIKTCTEEEHSHDDGCYQIQKSNEINLMSLDGNQASLSKSSNETILASTTLKVYSANYYVSGSGYDNVIIAYSSKNQTVAEALGSSGMSFTYWDAVVVSVQDGNYVVTQIITSSTTKSTLKVPQNGFIVLVNSSFENEIANVTVGMNVTSDFDFTKKVSNTSGIGNLSFGKKVSLKPSYDNSNNLNIVEGADTRDLIEVNLYDYGTSINSMYDSNSKYPGFQQDGGTKSLSSLAEYNFNFGNNVTTDIDMINTSIAHEDGTLDINSINNINNASINRPIFGVMNKYLINDYPALSDGTSLSYLFSNNTSTSTIKKNNNSINGLFKYNQTTGSYSYNSRENHAQYNISDDTFTLYEEIITSNFMMYPFGNFLPFNSIVNQATKASTINRNYFDTISESALYKSINGYGNEYSALSNSLTTFANLMDVEYGSGWDAGNAVSAYFKYAAGLNDINFETSKLDKVYSIDYDEATNFFFGLEMKMSFMQPKDGMTGINGQEKMKFYFTGDDDVWVYIDDILFLDLTGIHRHVGGEIDFYNGLVNYYDLDPATGDVKEIPTKTIKFSEILGSSDSLNEKGIFENYSTHTFNFYYMERGAGSGVMRMNFNMPLLKKNNISVTKELSVDTGNYLGNPDFKFQILSATGDIKTENPFIGKGVAYEILNQNGNIEGTATVGDNGIFTLKAGQTAVFSGIDENTGRYYVRELLNDEWALQYKEVKVDGTVTTSYNEITVGTEKFSGIETNIKDVSNGNTYFYFNNKIDTYKYGALLLKKVIVGQSINSQDRDFTFKVKIDGELLPIGTIYKVTDKQGNTTNREITKELGAGIIVFKVDEVIEISNILVGSNYEVSEIVPSDYTVSYENNIGIITKPSELVTVTTTNTEKQTSLEIPFKKIIENPDNKEHTYKFSLVQITSEDDFTAISDSFETSISDIETVKDFKFDITFYEPDYKNGDKLYYKIIEVDESDLNTKYDDSVYIIEVTITKTETTFSANITKYIKIKDNIKDIVSEIEFKNQILTNLNISKKVKNDNPNSGTFEFEIMATYQNKPLFGEFKTEKNDKSNGIVSFVDGKAIIYLKNNETITIIGLPHQMSYQITETTTNGYVVEHQVNPVNETDNIEIGSVVSGNLGDTNHIKFINIGEYKLPETGSSLMLILIIIGLLLLLTPIIYIGYMFYKRERKVS